jgi:hypothetical protein
MSLAQASLKTPLLPEDYRQHCMMRADDLGRQATQQDFANWVRLEQELGRAPSIWEYVCRKLEIVLMGRRKKEGQAAKAFRAALQAGGVIQQGFIYACGQSESEQCSDAAAGGDQWWPIIWIVVRGDIWPMYCPALAWAFARPWMCSSKRLWLMPQHWAPPLTNGNFGVPPPPPPMSNVGVPPPPPPMPTLMDDDSSSTVEDMVGDDSSTVCPASAESWFDVTDNISSTSSSTPRRRRWGNK